MTRQTQDKLTLSSQLALIHSEALQLLDCLVIRYEESFYIQLPVHAFWKRPGTPM